MRCDAMRRETGTTWLGFLARRQKWASARYADDIFFISARPGIYVRGRSTGVTQRGTGIGKQQPAKPGETVRVDEELIPWEL